LKPKPSPDFSKLTRREVADTGLICDQTVALNGFYAAKHYPAHLRRIRYRDPETGKILVFLTNQFALPALTICALYRCRWQVELFFKWIKQHSRIKRFYGTSENAVRTQTGIAISVYVLVAIIKRHFVWTCPYIRCYRYCR
jgi:Transposase DDE domain